MPRPTVAEINLSALRHNFNTVKQLAGSGCKILAVVKANAYGHGAVEISRELEKCGADFLGVALCEEAMELRTAGVRTPILVMGGVYNSQAENVISQQLIPVVFDIDTAVNLDTVAARSGQRLKVHIKLDTGMGRIGILPGDIVDFFNRLKSCTFLDVDGLLTHLAIADMTGTAADDFTGTQVQTFLELAARIRDIGFNPRYLHCANSAAVIRHLEPCCNVVRPGIMLYGLSPTHWPGAVLRPVMTLKTRIIALKNVPPGTSISYRRTFITSRDSVIATLPIGYADGYSRHFSNRAPVLIRGRRACIVGTVCMDMAMVDVTDIPGVREQDEVILLGSQGDETIAAEELSEVAHSIPYELFCCIGSRVPRVYIRED